MFKFVFCLYVCASQVFSLNFNVKRVTRFSSDKNNTYFGYAVHLQRGSRPLVIVGAPKDDLKTGGAVYSCSQDTNSCIKYKYLTTYNNFTFTSNFLGSALDGSDLAGGELIVCSPRKVITGRDSGNPFQKGLCFYYKNSSISSDGISAQNIELNPLEKESFIDIHNGQPYYNYAFAESGFDVHIMKDTRKVLLGAPGVKTWSGSMIVQSLEYLKEKLILPPRPVPSMEEKHGYQGYSVSSGTFDSSFGQSQMVIGGPRANELDGSVQIFDDKKQIVKVFTSDETGSYYGAALLGLDVNHDGLDDLFVGAPFGRGNSYDEGYVYVYLSNSENRYKLQGSQKPAARFGSAIASLGDIDYDSYNDVAISAPNEDDGVGAVYIYMGGKNGVYETYSQRLSPLSFMPGLTTTKGFGLGLSRGNDIDRNGHNDLAVGAYRSGEVFLFYGLSIIDYKLTLKTNVSSVLTGSSMKVTYCVDYSQRSPVEDKKTVDFNFKLLLDYRTDGQQLYEENWTVQLKKIFCKAVIVKLIDTMGDINPYKLSLKAEILSDVVVKGENFAERLIPYSHGCGDDNICQTSVTLIFTEDSKKIILAKDKEITVDVEATNTGETGYQCQLIIDTPDHIELSQNSLCNLENKTYFCPFASKLQRQSLKKSSYKFDVSEITPTTPRFDINFEIKCLGENLEDGTGKVSFEVSLQNSPYIEGKSDPEKIYFQRSKAEDEELTHLFSVGNYGPSPVKLDVYFLLPIVQYDSKDIFQFSEVTRNSIRYNCIRTNNTELYQRTFKTESLVTEPLNETVVYDSYSEGVKYIELLCPGDYLFKSSQIARYEVKFKVNTKLIAEMYKKEVLKENVLAYITTAYLKNSTHKIEGHTVTTVQSAAENTPLLWVYITVGVILGIILLCLLIYLLYRCHFFERSLRDKMHGENLINEKNDGDENVDVESEVELRNSNDNNLRTDERLDLNTADNELK